jgi:hypothetical protein
VVIPNAVQDLRLLGLFASMKGRRSFLKLLSILACVLMLTSSGAFAALPQSAYDKLKAKAPEELTIKVLSVDVIDSVIAAASSRLGCSKWQVKEVCAKAEVTSVQRSTTGLRPGSIVQIVYTTAAIPEHADPGPFGPEILDTGMVRRAFLKQRGTRVTPDNAASMFDPTYDVAAWGQSFEKID